MGPPRKSWKEKEQSIQIDVRTESGVMATKGKDQRSNGKQSRHFDLHHHLSAHKNSKVEEVSHLLSRWVGNFLPTWPHPSFQFSSHFLSIVVVLRCRPSSKSAVRPLYCFLAVNGNAFIVHVCSTALTCVHNDGHFLLYDLQPHTVDYL